MKKRMSSRFKYVLAALAFIFALYLVLPVVDEAWGISLNERVTVTTHRFTPAHTQVGYKTSLPVPDSWQLDVANARGTGLIRVSSQDYEDIRDGDSLQVEGTQGRLSGHWYLNQLLKASPKK